MGDPTRQTRLALRTTAAYLDWVARLAKHLRTTTTDVVDRALVTLAASVGFEPPPSRR